MRWIVVALALAGCGKSAQEQLAERELARIEEDQAAARARAEALLRRPEEGGFEKLLSFECSQAWRDPKRSQYGLSWLTDKCRAEVEQAKVKWSSGK